MDNVALLVEKLGTQFNGGIEASEDGQAIFATKENIVKLLETLKNDYKYKVLCDLTAADYDEQFEVVYHVMTLENADVLRVKVKLPKDAPRIPSMISVWRAADVQEREAYDLMGINFEGHSNLKRILCPDDFVGHPLRKDFKLDIIDRF